MPQDSVPQSGSGQPNPDASPNGPLPFGAALEIAIGRCGHTKQSLAKKIRSSTRQLHRWINTNTTPRSDKKSALLEAFGGWESPLWSDPALQVLARELGVVRNYPPMAAVVPGGATANGNSPNGQGPATTPPETATPSSSENTQQTSEQRPTPGGLGPPPGPGHKERRAGRGRLWGIAAALGLVTVSAVIIGHVKSNNPPGNSLVPPRTLGDDIVRIEPADGAPWILHFASGRTLAIPMQSRHGHFSWNTGGRVADCTRIGEFHHGKGRMAVVVSIDTELPNHTSGELRIDYFDASGHVGPVFLEEEPIYGGQVYSRNEWSLEALRFLDWNMDQAGDVLVVATHTYFPSFLTIVCNAEREVSYFNAGHIKGVIALPASAYATLQNRPRMASALSALGLGAPRGPALAAVVEFNDRMRGAGLVVLPPRFRSGAYPADDPAYRHGMLPRLETAHYLRFPPSLIALRFTAHQNWPGSIEPWDDGAGSFRVTTLETPSGDGLMHRVGPGLAIRDVAFPDGALNNIDWHPQSAAERDSLAASLETVEVRRNGRWTKIRYAGTWIQRLKP